MTVIKFFNPKEKPFGVLSNNYTHFMTINGKQWRTVTNYVYANLLKTPMFKEQIRVTRKTDKIISEFQHLSQQETFNIMRKSLDIALKAKFSNSEQAKLLLATDDRPIIYVSSNTFLGIGNQNDGQNVYGKYLEQVRHYLRVTKQREEREMKKSDREKQIYETYLAKKALEQAIKSGNDLSEFLGKFPVEIINMVGKEELLRNLPPKNIVLNMKNLQTDKEFLHAVDNPLALVSLIRRDELGKLRLRKLSQQRAIVVDMYADYLLKKYYEKLPKELYDEAKAQQFEKLNWQDKRDMEERLFELYRSEMLSENLSNSIDRRLAEILIPSEEEVEAAELFTVTDIQNPKLDENTYISETGKPVLVYHTDFPQLQEEYKKYVSFSPVAVTGMLNIDGKNYPTVNHYLMVKIFESFSTVKTFQDAYNLILLDPKKPVTGLESFLVPEVIDQRYEELISFDRTVNIKKNLEEALDKKFEDRILQDYLLMTENKQLIYNDYSDPVLGSGEKGSGMNLTGGYLMILRDKIRTLRKREKIDKITTDQITLIMDEDVFMKNWLKMRVTDTCKTISLMKNYVHSNGHTKQIVNTSFVEAVLDQIYQPCSQIYGAANMIKVPFPTYFHTMVRQCPGFSNVTDEVVTVIWKRMAVSIYYLIQELKEKNIDNLRMMLVNIESSVSKGGNCPSMLSSTFDSFDNCILSALINLIRGIRKFNKQLSYKTGITEKDVFTATSIILNSSKVEPSNLSEQVCNVDDDGNIVCENEMIESDLGDIDEDESEQDYGDGGDGGDEFSPREAKREINKEILSVVSEMDDVEDPEELSRAIARAMTNIKSYYKIPVEVKKNRVNFFATQL